MTDFPASHRDLLDGQVASLATIGRNGFPQVTELWFLHDDGELKLSLFLLDLENPYRYLEVRGTARVEPDDDYEFANKLGAKYNADLKVHDQPGESRVVVTIEPANVYPVDMSGG
jgi:hypothetical protein